MAAQHRAAGVFRGWYVVGAAFLVTFIGFGTVYTFSAFVAPLQAQFGASRGSVSLVFSLAGFLYFAFGVVSGPLADRWGLRRIAAAGMLLIGLGLLLASQARTLTEVYVAYALGVGLGVGCAYVPALGAVQRWFDKRRALASGLAVAGIGVGTLIMPWLATLLISDFGWRHAYALLGLFAAVVGTAATLMLANDPRDHGLAPDGGSSRANVRKELAVDSTIGAAVRSRQFWVLYIVTLLCSVGAFVPFVHLVPHAMDLNTAPSSAALLVGVLGAGSTLGRFVLGSAADRMGYVRALAALMAGMGGAMLIWAMSGSFGQLVVFSALFGAFYGGWVAVLPTVVMHFFGGRNVSGIIGVLYTSVAFGTLIGPSFAGWIFDASGSYDLPIAAAAAANLLAAALVSLRLPADA